jgi:hypothetical protein
MTTLHVPAFIVVGGGPIGAGSARQLLRAQAAGRLTTDRIVVVDRDPRCAAAALPAPVELHVASWSPWLLDHLEGFGAGDHLVPDHWAPHLLRDWLAAALRRRGAQVESFPLEERRALPYEGPTRQGDRALSYASWICPPRCIEPALCPHTRGPRDWSLVGDLRRQDHPDLVPLVLPCRHLVYGVGTVPVAEILSVAALVAGGLGSGTRSYRIATSSHCHALASGLRVSCPPRGSMTATHLR